MSLTELEKYIISQTMYVYDQILNIHSYSVMFNGINLLVMWNANNKNIEQIFGNWKGNESDINEINEIICDYFIKNIDDRLDI